MSQQSVAKFQPPRLPWDSRIEDSFEALGVNKATWKALVESVYPGAKSIDSVIMVLSYCQARNLDPFKRPVHIVPIYSSQAKGYVDTVWQGISELRTTAMRTGAYAGSEPMEFGPEKTVTFEGKIKRKGQWTDVKETGTYPEWARMTIYRLVQGTRVPFSPPPVYWEEAYACEGNSEVPNSMWRKRIKGQLAKCCEAAALRFAFPEEVGNDYAAEEIDGQQFYGAENAKDVNPRSGETAKRSLDQFARTAATDDKADIKAKTEDEKPEPAKQEEKGGEVDPNERDGKTRREMHAELSKQIESGFDKAEALEQWGKSVADDIAWIGEALQAFADDLTKRLAERIEELR